MSSGAIRYNSGGYWEFSNDKATYYQFAPTTHTHVSANITDATSLAVAGAIVLRDGSQSAAFGTVTAGQSVFSGNYVVIGATNTAINLIKDNIQAITPNLSIRGSISIFKVNVQEQNGARINLLWNADQAANGNYLVSNEPAARWAIDTTTTGATFGAYSAAPGTAATGITWIRAFGTDDTNNFYVGPVSSPGTKITPAGAATFNGTVLAQAFETASALAVKTNVSEFNESALDIIKDLQLFRYNYKSAPEAVPRIGIIADYVQSELISGRDHDKSDLANTVGLLLRAVQELAEKLEQPTN
jgi:hypothetical protein